MDAISRRQALAFRLDRHHLSRRLEPDDLLAAAGACGLQNTPPGAAELSLHARLARLAPGDLDHLLYEERSLLQVWSLRAAPYIFPTADTAVFTRGLLPYEEAGLRYFMLGARAGLDAVRISAVELVTWTVAALETALDGRAMTKDELGLALSAMLESDLPPERLETWRSPSPVIPGQTLGESLVRFALPVAALHGVCCHAERLGEKAYLRRRDQWLSTGDPVAAICDGGSPGSPILATEAAASANGGSPKPLIPAPIAAAELLRHYLHCYAPSTPASFAAWAGISPKQARQAWTLIQPELEETTLDGRRGWRLAADASALQSPSQPSGVRFLPPHDPYLQARDRETLIPDQSLHRKVWRAVGNPGMLLVAGELAGLWRARKQSRSLRLEIELFTLLPSNLRAEVEAEAETLLPFKGCRSLQLRID